MKYYYTFLAVNRSTASEDMILLDSYRQIRQNCQADRNDEETSNKDNKDPFYDLHTLTLILSIRYAISSWTSMKIEGEEIEIKKEYVAKCLEEGHYIEAIALTHYVVHIHLSMTYEALASLMNPHYSIQVARRRKGKNKLYPLPAQDDYSYYRIHNVLFDMGIYDEKLYKRLTDFNKHRNEIIHELFKSLPSKQKIQEYGKLGLELWDETWDILVKCRQKHQSQIEKVSKN